MDEESHEANGSDTDSRYGSRQMAGAPLRQRATSKKIRAFLLADLVGQPQTLIFIA